MPIDPVKIPQDVEVEDRIIGPVSLRQLIISLIGAGISYAIWSGLQNTGSLNLVTGTLAWIPTILAVAFAFVQINGVSLFRMLLLAIERLHKPAKRQWKPRQGITINIVTKGGKQEKEEDDEDEQEDKTPPAQKRIHELSKTLDKGPTEATSRAQQETEIGEEGETEEEVEEASRRQQRRPVDPERIQAQERSRPIDDIAQAPQQRTESPRTQDPMVRDVTPPPPSHA